MAKRELKPLDSFGGHQYNNLVVMNDGQGNIPQLTWVEIADYIEENPENVFTKSV